MYDIVSQYFGSLYSYYKLTNIESVKGIHTQNWMCCLVQ